MAWEGREKHWRCNGLEGTERAKTFKTTKDRSAGVRELQGRCAKTAEMYAGWLSGCCAAPARAAGG
eukprot:5791885-Pyramimonas_sp.AAC.1